MTTPQISDPCPQTASVEFERLLGAVRDGKIQFGPDGWIYGGTAAYPPDVARLEALENDGALWLDRSLARDFTVPVRPARSDRVAVA